jgi:hypothetical protein
VIFFLPHLLTPKHSKVRYRMFDIISLPYCVMFRTLPYCTTSKSASHASTILCRNQCVRLCVRAASTRLRSVGFHLAKDARCPPLPLSAVVLEPLYIPEIASLHHCICNLVARDDTLPPNASLSSKRDCPPRAAAQTATRCDKSLMLAVLTLNTHSTKYASQANGGIKRLHTFHFVQIWREIIY